MERVSYLSSTENTTQPRKRRRVSLENDTINMPCPDDKHPLSDSESEGFTNCTCSFKRRRVSLDPILDGISINKETTKSTETKVALVDEHHMASNFQPCIPVHSVSNHVTRKLITPSPSILSIHYAEFSDSSDQCFSSGRFLSEPDTSDDSMGLDLEPSEIFAQPNVFPVEDHTTTPLVQETESTRPCPMIQSMSESSSRWHLLQETFRKCFHDSKDVRMTTLIPKSNDPTIGWKKLAHDVLLLSVILVAIVVFGQSVSIWKQFQSRLYLPGNDCIYVTGGGFSGFWFSLGRLNSIPRHEMTKQSFTCYSAGCLGVVSVYSNRTMQELYEMASGIQRHWNDGSLHRYHIVDNFVDNLLTDQEFDEQVLSSLHILTSVPQDTLGFRAVLNTPRNMDELRTLLMQTTWIPMAVGSEYTYQGHLDGAFSAWQHPQCNKHVGLANDWSLLSNTLNVNLSRDLVEKFWQLGLDYGI